MTAPMGDPVAIHLDHVGFIVRDLDATCDFMARLGFAQTARADHTRTNESGELVSAGSAQRSIMLRSGYIEMMQITDPAAGHQLAAAPALRFGLHVLAFGTPDAEACHRVCEGRGVPAGPVLRWARPVNETGLLGLARFAYFGAAWEPWDPSYLCWVEHRTPELLRSPQLLRHDNGALGLAGIHYRGPHAAGEAWIARLSAAGVAVIAARADGVDLGLPNASIRVEFDERRTAVLPTALVLEFADCTWLRARCLELGLALRDMERGAFELDLVQQLGLHWICRPAAAPATHGAGPGLGLRHPRFMDPGAGPG